MNNAIMYDYYSYGGSSDDEGKTAEEDPKSLEYKYKKIQKERGINLEESEEEQETPQEPEEAEDHDEEEDVVPELGAGVSKSALKNHES